MKGLLIKDFRLLKGQVYFLLIVTVCVIVFMINGSEAFGVAYVCSMVALLSWALLRKSQIARVRVRYWHFLK